MARYYESWKGENKTRFAPLPLEYMENAITGKQNEHDSIQNMLDTNIDFEYNTHIVDPTYIEQDKQSYLNDMSKLKEQMDGTMDFSGIMEQIKKVRTNHGIIDNNGVSYSQNVSGSNNNNTGSNFNNGSKSVKNNSYNSNGEFAFNTPKSNAVTNYNARKKADEEYNKMTNSYADAYHYYNVDKVDQNIVAQYGTDYKNHPLVEYEIINPFKEEEFESQTSSMLKGFNADGSEWRVANFDGNGYYSAIATESHINGSDVVRVGFGYVMANEGWNKHQEIMFTYGAEKTGAVNPNEYANEYFRRLAEDNLSNTKNWNEKSDADKEKLILQEQSNLMNSKLEEGINNYLSGIDNPTNEQREQAKNQLMFNYGLQEYKIQKALSVVDLAAERESFNKPGFKEVSMTMAGHEHLQTHQYNLENGVSVSQVNSKTLKLDPKERQNNIFTILTTADQLIPAIQNSNTKVNNSKDGLINSLFNIQQLKGIAAGKLSDGTKDAFQELINNNLIHENTDGTLMANNDNWKQIQQITGTKLDLKEFNTMITDYNKNVDELNTNQQDYNTNSYIANIYKKDWLNNGGVEDFVDSQFGTQDVFYSEQKKAPVKRYEINGQIQYITKKELLSAIKNGSSIKNAVLNTIFIFGIGEEYTTTPLNIDMNEHIAKNQANNPIGDQFVTRVEFSDDKSHIFDGVHANEKVLTNNNVFLGINDITGKTLQSQFTSINFKKPINVISCDETPVFIMGKPVVELKYTIEGVDKKDNKVTEIQSAYVYTKDIPQNQTSNAGLNTTDAQHGQFIAHALQQKQGVSIDNQSTDTQLRTDYQGCAYYSTNTQHDNIYQNNTDLIYYLNQNGEKGDRSKVVYKTGNVNIIYVKTSNDKSGLQMMSYTDDNPNHLMLITNFNNITDGQGAMIQLGEIDLNVNTTGFYLPGNVKVKPID